MNRKDYYRKNTSAYIEESQGFDMTAFYQTVESSLENIILTQKKSIPEVSILDLGFGSARDMVHFSNKGFLVEGVDSCEGFVKYAKGLDLNVHEQELPSLDILPENKTYDMIYTVGVLMHLNKEDRLELFKNIKERLNLHGYFIVSYNTLDRSTDPEREFFTLNEEEITKEVDMVRSSQVIIKDKRGFNWVTETFYKES